MLMHAANAIIPGGTLVYIGITRSSIASDIPDEFLATPDEIVTALSELTIERVDVSSRTIEMPDENFKANVMTVRAKRPL